MPRRIRDMADRSANPERAVRPADDVAAWRRARLLRAGFDDQAAGALSLELDVDLHALLELVDRGCPPELAARIMAPLDRQTRPDRP